MSLYFVIVLYLRDEFYSISQAQRGSKLNKALKYHQRETRNLHLYNMCGWNNFTT